VVVETSISKGRITFPAIGLTTSRLGFGTSLLMARLNRSQSVRLLETAFDSGITHFDTARLYGYGEAEVALGDLLRRRRDQVTVTTKFGILPPRRSVVLNAVKSIARKVVVLQPRLREPFRRKAESMIKSGVFDIPVLTQSLETSLKALGTDYVDILLLHECTETDTRNPKILAFLENLQSTGKIRAFGIATSAIHTGAILRANSRYCPVVQFQSSVFEPHQASLPIPPDSAIFTHSALSRGFQSLSSDLDTHPAMAQRWSEQLHIDCANRPEMAALLLRYAMSDNINGTVLFSSSVRENIVRNAAQLEAQPMHEGIRNALSQLIRDYLATPIGAYPS